MTTDGKMNVTLFALLELNVLHILIDMLIVGSMFSS